MGKVAKINSGFALAPRSIDEAMQIAKMLSDSTLVPPQYKQKPEDTLVAMLLGSELGLNPIQSLQNIAVINNRPSIYGDALAALVQNHPAFGGMEESFDDASMTATCTVWRKGGTHHIQTFSREDATVAGLWNKSGPWKQYPKRMLTMRARGFALRGQFADALAGLITREEAEDMPQDIERDITPVREAIAPMEHKKQLIADERLTKAIEKINAGEYTSESLHKNFALTDEQIDRVADEVAQ